MTLEDDARRIAAAWATEHQKRWALPASALLSNESGRRLWLIQSNAQGKGYSLAITIDDATGLVIAHHEYPSFRRIRFARAVTRAEKRRRRWKFPVTPSGLEKGRNVTGERSRTGPSTETTAEERPEVTAQCNECNEALAEARNALGVARRLALVAENAIVNGDLDRACAAVREIHEPAAETRHSSDAGERRA
jgi:hypothetical protein